MSIESGKVGMRSDGDYDYKVYWLKCDNCGLTKYFNDEICDFMKIVELKKTKAKSQGWTCKKYGNGWVDICPRCNE